MQFSLKNAGATYQRMATALSHDMMHNKVEVYVNDMIVKSKDRESHTINLRKFFKRIKEFRLRLNLQMCTFRVTAGEFIIFLVSGRRIKVDPSKIKVILEMPPPRSEKEIKGFLGRLQYISRFITKLASTCEPIFKLLRKNEPHTWNDECQKAFKLIKEYLLHPSILVPPQHGKPLLLYYLSKNERAIYYLSKRFHDYETRYTPIEKLCFALVWAVQKLRHILLPFQIWVVAKMNSLKYLFEKPTLSGRLSRWLIIGRIQFKVCG